MTDSKGSPEPVVVEITLNEWKWVNSHSYEKTIEIDPVEWAEMIPYDRERYINDRIEEFANECLEGDFKILSGHEVDDPVSGE